jgi:hypothetical protein
MPSHKQQQADLKLQFMRRMVVGIFLFFCAIIAAYIALNAMGRPFPRDVLYFAIGSAALFGVLSLLHFSVFGGSKVKMNAKVSKDSGQIDFEA